MTTGVLIPCYNEALSVGNVIKNALLYVRDVIVVDDGSSDGTGEAAESAGAIVLRHQVNKGKGESLRTGFGYIKENKNWDSVIIMDGDGQHDPGDLPRFIETAQKENAGIVIGDRMTGLGPKGAMPFIRWLTNKTTSYIISKLIGQKIPDSQCGYRLIKTDVLKDLELKTSRFDTESEILIKSAKRGYKIISLPIKIIYRNEVSYINPVRDTLRFIKLIYAGIFRY